MKKAISLLLSFVMLLSMVSIADFSTFADTAEQIRCYYYEKEDGTIEISGCGSEITSLDIPSTVDGKTVTSIGNCAFDCHTKLTSVTIPDTVTDICDNAFEYCNNLTEIIIPSSVENIGKGAFEDCVSLNKIVIPSSVKNIALDAFEDCYFTKENFIDNTGKTNTDNYGTNLIDYEDNGFCMQGNTLVKLRPSFSTSNVTLPDYVHSIDSFVFEYCDNIKNITLSKNVTSIDLLAFCYCKNVESVNVVDDNENYSSVDGVLFDKNKNDLILYPVCKNNDYYVIPDGVTSIWYGAFSSDFLRRLVIPKSMEYIEKYSLECSNLEMIEYNGTKKTME